MVASTGLFKTVAIGPELVAWNTPALTGAGKLMRRTQSTLSLKADNYRSNEIRANRQLVDFRLGTRTVDGKLDGELSPGTYKLLMEGMLAGAFAAGVSSTALTNVTAAAGPPGTFTRATGSFITDGFKVGDVIRWAGWATGGSTANNARNYRITALTATVMTVGTAATGAAGKAEAVVAQASGDSVTATVVGKKLITPQAGSLLDQSYTIEHWFSDNGFSELHTGCKPTQMDLGLPASGLATISTTIMGGGLTTNTAQFFTAPTAASTTGITAAVNGVLRVGGVDVANVTGLTISIKGGHSTEKVVGSQFTPGVFPGQLDVTGQLTALFDSTVYRDAFLAETVMSLDAVLTLNGNVNSDFIAFHVPALKFTDDGKDDKPGAITGTYPFQAVENVNGGAATNGDDSTITIQDSLA